MTIKELNEMETISTFACERGNVQVKIVDGDYKLGVIEYDGEESLVGEFFQSVWWSYWMNNDEEI